MPTMGAQLELSAQRRSDAGASAYRSVIYQVAQAAAGRRSRPAFRMGEKDIFALPSWALHRMARTRIVLFSFDDLPAMRALGLYREANSNR